MKYVVAEAGSFTDGGAQQLWTNEVGENPLPRVGEYLGNVVLRQLYRVIAVTYIYNLNELSHIVILVEKK